MSHDLRQCIDSVDRGAREEELALLAGGDLPPEEAARLERHAERCPACRATVAGLRESLAGIALLAAEDLGPERAAERSALERVRAGVLAGAARIEAERSDGRVGEAGSAEGADDRRLRWALAAVLLVALLGAAVWLRSGVAPEPVGMSPERFAKRTAPAEPPEELPPPPGSPAADSSARPEEADRLDRPDRPDQPDRSDGATGPEPPVRLARSTVAPEDEPIVADPPADPPAQLAEDRPAEPRITIRIVSDDPDIVFYWLVEPEENRDETVSS